MRGRKAKGWDGFQEGKGGLDRRQNGYVGDRMMQLVMESGNWRQFGDIGDGLVLISVGWVLCIGVGWVLIFWELMVERK